MTSLTRSKAELLKEEEEEKKTRCHRRVIENKEATVTAAV